jgi:hypothetical protein
MNMYDVAANQYGASLNVNYDTTMMPLSREGKMGEELLQLFEFIRVTQINRHPSLPQDESMGIIGNLPQRLQIAAVLRIVDDAR